MEIRMMRPDEVEQVFGLWNAGCVAAVGTPLDASAAQNVRTVLAKYPAAQNAACFVAVEAEQVIGFVTCAALDHPVLLGRSGEIEELLVDPAADRAAVGAALVNQALLYLKQRNANSIHTNVAADEPGDITFWQQLGWENDTLIFSIYGDVPGDPALQQTWNAYEVQ